MSRISLVETSIPLVRVLERDFIGDRRGGLRRLFCDQELADILQGRVIRQINQTITHARGTVRGMHFQYPPHAEMKIVTCTKGRVFDVALDLRRDSRTFLKWHAEILDGTSSRSLFIPEGCAHGFQTLDDDCEMLYFHTSAYLKEAEGGIHPNDPCVGIVWPLPFTELSERDASHPMLTHDYVGIDL